MKIALVYDWLNTKVGGGEEVFLRIAKLYPDADIVCLIYNKKLFSSKLGERTVRTSRLQKFPRFMKSRPALLLPFIPKSVDKLDFEGYDMVISVSSAWVKNITVPKNTLHVSYCYSPARMIWDSWPKYLDSQRLGPFRLGRISKLVVTKIVSRIRLWDYYKTDGVDAFIVISHFIAGRVKKFYKRDSVVVYPPVNLPSMPKLLKKQDFFLVLSTLAPYKQVDIAIEACIATQSRLIIAGDGSDMQRLVSIAKKSKYIEFAGRVTSEQKWRLLALAKALLFTSIEDFGIAPVEAIASGTPVIALKGGGLQETVEDGVSGIFFDQPTAQSLAEALKTFNPASFNPTGMASLAKRFGSETFEENLVNAITNATKEYQHGKS